MSSVIVIETSTPRASIARVAGGTVIQHRSFTSDRHHNAMLFEPLEATLHEPAEPRPALVLVGTGPGSYSGTRVGIAAAQGLALAIGCPVVGVASILAVPSADHGRPCLAIGDARRGSFWSAPIESQRLLHEPRLSTAEDLINEVARAVADGQAVIAFEEAARFPLPDELRSEVRHEFPDATRLWQAWQAQDERTRDEWLSKVPQPIYLKPPHITKGNRPRLIQP